MDPCSSGEDFIVKTRKPYTITKQRERWTQEEHNRFLEALKLYGRAWQRIEEHIGTKTAVQIRSHAQKFFTKLEKEAVLKGVPEGHTLDIEIPPPRPKRKPSNPYPRKTSIGAQAMHSVTKDGGLSNTVSSSSSCQSKITEDLERRHEKRCDDGKLKLDDRYNNDDCSKVLGKASPPNMAPRKLFTFKEYVPPLNRTSDPQDMTMSHVTIEAGGCQANTAEKDLFKDSGSFNTSSIDNSYHSLEKSMHHDRRKDELKHSENIERFPITDVNSSLNYPRHVPVHILDGALGKSGEYITPGRGVTESVLHQAGGFHQHHNHCNPAASVYSEYDNASRSSDPNAFQSFNPVFPQIQSREDYLSFLHMSSTFSSHIVSALLQNPAAHAAASFAATLWPCVSMEAPVESPAGLESRQQTNSTPSLAAIAAATVAAAAAWWAAHGLLPLCAPFHPGLTFTPASTSLTPVESGQTRFVNNERKENSPDPALIGEKLEPECSKALQEHLSALKPPTVSSSDSERSESAKLNSGVPTAIEGEDAEAAKPVDESQVHDSSKCNNRKQVDRSSCGSNTPSSSEVDADVLEKQPKGNEENYTKDKEELKEVDLMHLTGDASGRRCRIATNLTNDSWKEVSEGGRLAFQALFRREVLPQSFSPPLDLINKVKNIKTQKGDFSAEEKGETELRWDNNYTRWIDCSQKQGVEGNVTLNGENTEEELANAKLKSRQTGFIPYKRCSAEAKDSRGSANCQDEEKGHKRIRLEGW